MKREIMNELTDDMEATEDEAEDVKGGVEKFAAHKDLERHYMHKDGKTHR